MSMELIVRCDKCGKVLKGRSEKDQISGQCPRCNDNFVIADPVSEESRTNKRLVIGESSLVYSVPEHLTVSNDEPVFHVMFTEVPPIDFAEKRSDYVPILDLSDGGMGILTQVNEESGKLLPGNMFVVEIDFPVLVQPIFVEVEVCWIRKIKNDSLMQIGLRFHEPDNSFIQVLKNLMKYIDSRNEILEFDKWGSFG